MIALTLASMGNGVNQSLWSKTKERGQTKRLHAPTVWSPPVGHGATGPSLGPPLSNTRFCNPGPWVPELRISGGRLCLCQEVQTLLNVSSLSNRDVRTGAQVVVT